MELTVKILLALTSVAGLGVIVWRGWMLQWNKVVPPAIAGALENTQKGGGGLENVRVACEQNPSSLGRLVLHTVDKLGWEQAEVMDSLQTAARHEIVRLERGLVVLEIIVGIAPLLGLVGTIIGMIAVFGDLGQTGLNNMNDAGKLAQGISYILETTLIGLLICIPALIAWSYFSKKVEVIAIEMEALCDEFIRRQYSK